MRALLYRIGHKPINPDHGEQQGRCSEDRQEQRVESSASGRLRYDLSHGSDMRHSKPPLTWRSSFSIAGLSKRGAARVRMIQTSDKARAASALIPSVTCAIGTYTIGLGS